MPRFALSLLNYFLGFFIVVNVAQIIGKCENYTGYNPLNA